MEILLPTNFKDSVNDLFKVHRKLLTRIDNIWEDSINIKSLFWTIAYGVPSVCWKSVTEAWTRMLRKGEVLEAMLASTYIPVGRYTCNSRSHISWQYSWINSFKISKCNMPKIIAQTTASTLAIATSLKKCSNKNFLQCLNCYVTYINRTKICKRKCSCSFQTISEGNERNTQLSQFTLSLNLFLSQENIFFF